MNHILYGYICITNELTSNSDHLKDDGMSSWCGWHTDHGSLTGLDFLTQLIYFFMSILKQQPFIIYIMLSTVKEKFNHLTLKLCSRILKTVS